MSFRNQFTGIWLFNAQMIVYQGILIGTETWFYLKHMRRLDCNSTPPRHFELDVTLLVLLLLSLGVHHLLHVIPNILIQVQFNPFQIPGEVFIFGEFMFAIFSWMQVAV